MDGETGDLAMGGGEDPRGLKRQTGTSRDDLANTPQGEQMHGGEGRYP